MGLLLLVACGGAGGGETIDLVDGLYRGFPSAGEPDDGVRVEDPDTTVEIEFYANSSELWADIGLQGTMVLHGVKIEDEEDTVEGVTVDGLDLACSSKVEGIKFKVEGLFSENRLSLWIDIEHVGTMTLELVVEDEASDTPDTGDTGAV
jgi:hypothetical protein